MAVVAWWVKGTLKTFLTEYVMHVTVTAMTCTFDTAISAAIQANELEQSRLKARDQARRELAAMSAAMVEEHGLLSHVQAALISDVSPKRIGESSSDWGSCKFDFLGRTYVSVREVRARIERQVKAGRPRRGLVQRTVASVKAALKTDAAQAKLGGYAGGSYEEGETEEEMSEEDRLLTIKEVAALVTFSGRKIWRDVAAKLFPQPIKLGPKTTRWWQSDVLRFLRGEWKP